MAGQPAVLASADRGQDAAIDPAMIGNGTVALAMGGAGPTTSSRDLDPYRG